MVSKEYSEAASEVLEILKFMKNDDVQKIPRKFIEFLEKNSSKTYKVKLEHSKNIFDMNLKPKTTAILGIIYLHYWADEKDKEKFIKKAKENEERIENELTEKYNIDNLFYSKKQETITNEIQNNENLAIEIANENFIQKIIKKIKKYLRRIRRR